MKRKNDSDIFRNEYCFDSFNSKKGYNDVTSVVWGEKDHVKSKKQSIKNKDLIINNRFDFGNDANVLMRNTKTSNLKLPNIFNLKKVEEENN